MQQFTKDSLFFFLDLLAVLAEWENYLERVTSIMVTLPCLVFHVCVRSERESQDSVYSNIEKLKTIVVDFEFRLIQRGCRRRRGVHA